MNVNYNNDDVQPWGVGDGTPHTRPYCIKSLCDCQNNEAGDSMAVHELAGTKVRKEDYIDLKAIAAAYHTTHPDVADPHQQVRFGTSGHRGQAGNGSFTQDHVAAITQAVCNFRKQFGAEGPLFVGEDTHYLSKLAYETVLSVLAANGVTAYVDSEGDFVPTPSVSRAILRYNRRREERLADGLIITPSHNPPEHGGRGPQVPSLRRSPSYPTA